MKVVICAGGKGTRISSLYSDIPKPMINICGKPILEHQIISLKKQGFKDFIITVSYMYDKIINYFKDGKSLGVNIEYYIEEEPLGNAGALFKIKNQLTEDFVVINGDSLFDIDMFRMIEFHKSRGGLATIFTHPNSHPYDSGLIICDDNGAVIELISKEDRHPIWYKNRVNAGIHILSPQVLNFKIGKDKIDLDRDILKLLCSLKELYAYDSPEYVRDMGTPERFASVCNDFKNGIITLKNLLNKQKAIFLDRDGTINEYVGFLTNIDDFRLIDRVDDAIKLINSTEFLSIVVTNQPVIARGEVTPNELEQIHNKMETLLGKKGAYVDDVYYCPHHPERGFEGERLEYKIDCDCRKPKPGMLIKAAQKYNIDLTQSWMIGDGKSDILAGKNAGCKTIYIGKEDDSIPSDYTACDLLEAVEIIVRTT